MAADIPNIVDARGLKKDEEEIAAKASKSTSVLPTRLFHLPISTSSGSGFQTPCLLFSNNNINKIFHPLYNECRDIDFKFVAGTQVYAAKNDWLLLCELQCRPFFFNPFTKTKIEIPRLPCVGTRSMCFTSLPTSTDWQIVAGAVEGLGVVENQRTIICSIKCGDENWSTVDYDIDFDFSFGSAVMHKGSFYFFDINANVLIYNHEKRTAHTYMAPTCINKHIDARDERYLLEINAGKLMAVFVSGDGSWIRTCQWDNHRKTWKRVWSLGNKTLFVSRASSLCEEASVQETRNTIYFPRFVEDRCLLYSLSTKKYHTLEIDHSSKSFGESMVSRKKYHTFENGYSSESFGGSRVPLGCTITWIRP